MNLNFVILSISKSCLLLPDQMLELLTPTQEGWLIAHTGRELPCPRTPDGHGTPQPGSGRGCCYPAPHRAANQGEGTLPSQRRMADWCRADLKGRSFKAISKSGQWETASNKFGCEGGEHSLLPYLVEQTPGWALLEESQERPEATAGDWLNNST